MYFWGKLHMHLSVESDPRELLSYETSIKGTQTRSQLFKSWIALSTGQITLQWISVGETNCVIHWIEIYPVNSAIQLLNNWGQYNWKGMVKFIYMRPAS